MDKANKPTALRNLIDVQKEDLEIGVFADQLLTAKSWYQGKDSNAMELIIADMIDSVIMGEEELEDAVRLGVQRVQQTIN